MEFVFVSNKCHAREICNIYLHYGNFQSGTFYWNIVQFSLCDEHIAKKKTKYTRTI